VVIKDAVTKEIEWGPDFSRLPPGIRGGRARLTYCRFEPVGKDYPDNGIKMTDWQYRARAVMLEPESVIVDGVEQPVAGLQTSEFPVVITCDVKRGDKVVSKADALHDVINKMRRLGANFSANGDEVNQLEPLAAALEKSGPVFDVSTSLSKDGRRVWENWNGIKDVPADYQPPSAEAGVQDGTPESGGQDAGGEDEVDVDALAAEASTMSLDDAVAEGAPGWRMVQAAEAVGGTELADQVRAAATWEEGAELIKAAAGGEQQAPEPEPWKPAKGATVNHFPPIKNKTGRMEKGKKAVPCEVEAVNKDGSLNLVQLANRKIKYTKVKAEDVMPA
jgi:hypothetical protein